MTYTEKKVYLCSTCSKVFWDKDVADTCCASKLCECGQPVDRPYTKCENCLHEANKARATIVSPEEYGAEPVYSPAFGSYFDCVDEYWEQIYLSDGEEPEEYLHGVKKEVVELDADDILTTFCQDAETEDRELDLSDLAGVAAFREAVAAFNRENSQIVWYEDAKTWIKLPTVSKNTHCTE